MSRGRRNPVVSQMTRIESIRTETELRMLHRKLSSGLAEICEQSVDGLRISGA